MHWVWCVIAAGACSWLMSISLRNYWTIIVSLSSVYFHSLHLVLLLTINLFFNSSWEDWPYFGAVTCGGSSIPHLFALGCMCYMGLEQLFCSLWIWISLCYCLVGIWLCLCLGWFEICIHDLVVLCCYSALWDNGYCLHHLQHRRVNWVLNLCAHLISYPFNFFLSFSCRSYIGYSW
jgi:hypothetical protein